MHATAGRNVLIGVSGGIAAYKTPDVVRRLRDQGANVRVAMTAGARAFVQPLTFQAVSGQPVHHDLLDTEAEAAMGHIELARWADEILIAPASADFMARLAHGLADDLLTTLCLASDARIWLAPAMNRLMWANEATQANARILRERGFQILGPGEGDQACGELGAGRMLEPAELVTALDDTPAGDLSGCQVLITAGPTREPIDPVRYITNRSSGRMGFAIATAARERGARVTLIAGPSALPTPQGVDRIDVETAMEMHDAVMAHRSLADIVVATAAVADYRPAETAAMKLKKEESTGNLTLTRNPDILTALASADSQRPRLVVGFAAETNDLVANARDKLARKNADLIAANRVGEPNSGFDSTVNALELISAQTTVTLPAADKSALARDLMAHIAEQYYATADPHP